MSKPTTKTRTTKPTAPSRQHPITGAALLALLTDLVRTQQAYDATEHGATAYEAIKEVSRTMALVPPSTPEEALAAVCLLYDDAEEFDQPKVWTEEQIWVWTRRMRMRAIALAAWIETAHGIRREAHRLDYFCDPKAEQELLPHSPGHPWGGQGVAPLRAGFDASHEKAAA